MIEYLKAKVQAVRARFTDPPEDEAEGSPATYLTGDLSEDMVALREKYHNSSDFLTREITIENVRVDFLMIEGMVNLQTMSEILLEPLLNQKFGQNVPAKAIYDFIEEKSIMAADMKDIFTYEEVFQFIMSGFVVILIDGLPRGIAFGLQGFTFRSITEPSSEVNERGSREGFTEPLRINMTMVRRRIKSPNLKFELFPVGRASKTDICLIYMTDKVSDRMLRDVRHRIKQIKLDIILTSGYIQPFLEGRPWSLFSDVGTTERPDTLAAKIFEGRIGILVDGTPFALIVPYLFSENFQSLDDYAHRAYYASFIRIIKYLSFAAGILLPAVYVAIGTFHPELFPHALLFNVAAAEETTPFPLALEALIIHLLYEIMREAGLRLPSPIGHAVSIVGALVIGDAAVTAGIIGAPMVLVVATTAIASFVVPSLYEPISLLRFLFIVIGGTTGLYGIALGCMVLLTNACALNTLGSPYLSPIAPFSLSAMRDTFFRLSFTRLQHKNAKIQDLNGVEINSHEEE